MKHTAVNPYLPLYEYVPDGEPRLFDGRVYLYGSHDTAGGDFFCLEDYVAWSAPEDDLGDWRYEGVIYRKDQDPSNPDGKLELFAPDVVQGPDGHYYLYYCLRMRREFGVAVSDSPAGPFAFYSHIQKPDGSVLEDAMPYDPSVLVDEDGKIYLYYGFASEMLGKKYGFVKSPGAMMVQLDSDMRTAVTEPVLCIPGEDEAPGTSFAGHAYVEAPSMRRFGDLYYFVYSSQRWHELCYAVSSRPDGGFIYGGVIVDNADLGLNGRTLPVCMPGNNHGGLIQAGGKCYMFYHRHTNCTSFSRQGCAEQVQLLPGGRIPQVEVTSCGLNGGPLLAEGNWPAAIACQLYGADQASMLDFRNVARNTVPFITETGTGSPSPQQFICNIQGGTVAGYKYFVFSAALAVVTLWLRGTMAGALRLCLDAPDAPPAAQSPLELAAADWQPVTLTLPSLPTGAHSLYFCFDGAGRCDFLRFTFH